MSRNDKVIYLMMLIAVFLVGMIFGRANKQVDLSASMFEELKSNDRFQIVFNDGAYDLDLIDRSGATTPIKGMVMVSKKKRFEEDGGRLTLNGYLIIK